MHKSYVKYTFIISSVNQRLTICNLFLVEDRIYAWIMQHVWGVFSIKPVTERSLVK